MGYSLLRASYSGAALFAVAHAAHAVNIPTLEPNEVEFESPRGCPDRAAFLAAVNERATGSRPVRIDAAFRLVRVRVEKRDGGAHGSIQIREPDGQFAERRVEAGTCSEVTTALALITSVAYESERDPLDEPPPLDAQPLAAARKQPTRHEPEANEGSTGAAESVFNGGLVTRRTRPSIQNAPSAKAEGDGWMPVDHDKHNDALTNVFGPRTPHGWWAIGAQVGVVAGPLPGLAMSPSLFVDARIDPVGGWTPSARLSAKRALYESGGEDDRVELSWTSGRADLCPLSAHLGEPELRFWPCGTFEAAFLSARGTSAAILPGDQYPALYFSTGMVARLQWILLDVLLLETEAGAAVPLSRPHLGTTTSAALEVADVQAYWSAGVGGRFP